MTATTIDFSLLDHVQTGGQFRIRFRKEAIEDLTYLEAMARGGYIEMRPGERALLEVVRADRSWGQDLNRTFTVTATDKFSREFFEGRMRRALESLEIDHVVQLT